MARRRRSFILLEPLAIRDTVTHYPTETLPIHKATNWGFVVYNGCNQAVTVTLIGGDSPTPPSNGDVTAGVSIAANTTAPVATNIYSSYLSLRASYAVAPTSGSLQITGWIQEEVDANAPVPGQVYGRNY